MAFYFGIDFMPLGESIQCWAFNLMEFHDYCVYNIHLNKS